MSELPRTDDLPRAEDELDPARVEEAFARFGERVRELESVTADLRSELRALRAERPRNTASADEDWPLDAPAPPADWLARIPPPVARRLAAPRLAVEIVFLLAVGLLAGLADLETPWIVGVMAAAWALVALSEWSAAAKRARWRLEELPPPLTQHADDESTGPWSMPVVEATVVEAADASESHTVVTPLPPPATADEAGDEQSGEEPGEQGEVAAEESTDAAEETGHGRRFWRRRRAQVEPSPDPWEQ